MLYWGAHPLNALVALVVFSHSVCVLVVVLLLGGHRVTVQVTLRIRALAPFVFLFVQSLFEKETTSYIIVCYPSTRDLFYQSTRIAINNTARNWLSKTFFSPIIMDISFSRKRNWKTRFIQAKVRILLMNQGEREQK